MYFKLQNNWSFVRLILSLHIRYLESCLAHGMPGLMLNVYERKGNLNKQDLGSDWAVRIYGGNNWHNFLTVLENSLQLGYRREEKILWSLSMIVEWHLVQCLYFDVAQCDKFVKAKDR